MLGCLCDKKVGAHDEINWKSYQITMVNLFFLNFFLLAFLSFTCFPTDASEISVLVCLLNVSGLLLEYAKESMFSLNDSKSNK